MKLFKRILSAGLPASFTIEAAVILPITFLITAWFLASAIGLHNRVISYTDAIFEIMRSAPYDLPENAAGPEQPENASINMKNLDARKVLLSYKLLKDGARAITGGFNDED